MNERKIDYIIFYLALIVTAILITFGGFKILDTGIVITAIISIISATLGVLSYRQNSAKVELEIFEKYNRRYEDINEKLEMENIEGYNTVLNKYINLCSEEYLLFKRNLVSNDIWNDWKIGFEDKANKNKTIKEFIIKEAKNEQDSSYGFLKLIDQKEYQISNTIRIAERKRRRTKAST